MTLLLAAALALGSKGVQTAVSSLVVKRLDAFPDAAVSVGSVELVPFTNLVLRDLCIVDRSPVTDSSLLRGKAPSDTLIYAGRISASFTLKGILNGIRNSDPRKPFILRRLSVNNAKLCIVSEQGPDGIEYYSNLARLFNIPPPPETPEQTPDLFSVRKVSVSNLRFRHLNATGQEDYLYGGFGIDWNCISFPRIDAKAHGLQWTDSRLSCTFDSISGVEQCGYRILDGSGRLRAGMGSTVITGLKLSDPWSHIDIPTLTMTYANQYEFNRFVDGVQIDARFNPSTLGLSSVAYFAGGPEGCPVTLGIKEGVVSGTVNNLDLSGLRIVDTLSGIALDTSGNIRWLAQPEKMRLGFDAVRLHFGSSGLGRLIGAFSTDAAPDLSGIAPGQVFEYRGSIKGPCGRLRIAGKILSGIGELEENIVLSSLFDNSGKPAAEGSISTRDLDLGIITGERRLGPLSLEADVRAELGDSDGQVTISRLSIDRLQALGYDYRNISGSGVIRGNSYSGVLMGNDENLQFVFSGLAGMSRKTGKYTLNGELRLNGANIRELGLLNANSQEVNIVGTANANFILENEDRMYGSIVVSDPKISLDNRDYSIGKVDIRSIVQDGRNIVTVTSAYANLEYNGDRPMLDIMENLERYTTRRYLPALYEDALPEPPAADFTLKGSLGEIDGLVNFVFPQVHVYKGMGIEARLDQDGVFEANATIPSASFSDGKTKVFGRDVGASIDNSEGPMKANLALAQLGYGNDLRFSGVSVNAQAIANTYCLHCSYTDDVLSGSSADISAKGALSREDGIRISASPADSRFVLRGCEWEIGKSEISVGRDRIVFDSLSLRSADQRILLDGSYDLHNADSLMLEAKNLNLGSIATMLGQGLDIEGLVNGSVRIVSPIGEKIEIDGSIGSTPVTLGGRNIGSFSLSSRYDPRQGRLHIEGSNTKRGRKVINIKKIDYTPADTDIVAMVQIDSLEISDYQSLFEGMATITSGTLNGKVTAIGRPDKLDLASSSINISDCRTKLAITGAEYVINGPMTLKKDSFRLNGVEVKDTRGGGGVINGGISFRGGILDLGIDLRRLQLLDKPDDGSAFYGRLYASGKAGLTGPLDNMHVTVDAHTDRDGRLVLKLAPEISDDGNGILSFRVPEMDEPEIDPIESFLSAMGEDGKRTQLTLDATIKASPQLEVVINLDDESSNVITARGNGELKLSADAAKGTFDINGDYNIASGNYSFSALRNMAARNFDIREGSTIRFNGDPMDSNLDVSAVYNVRTTLSALISDTTSVSTRRNVECGIHITDNLSSPKVAVSVTVPELNAATKGLVESELNTEDKQYKQFLALLLTGNFVPNEQSGIVNNTDSNNLLFSNISSIMSNQMSDIIQTLGIPVDLGLSYQQNEGGKDVFDVAVSTKLFNDRVLVNGSVGNRRYSAQSDDSMVGDIDLEMKLNSSGQTRLKLFSHSADDYTSYLDNTQRNGIGLSWQKEFNSIGELFRREQDASGAAAEPAETSYRKLTIERNGK